MAAAARHGGAAARTRGDRPGASAGRRARLLPGGPPRLKPRWTRHGEAGRESEGNARIVRPRILTRVPGARQPPGDVVALPAHRSPMWPGDSPAGWRERVHRDRARCPRFESKLPGGDRVGTNSGNAMRCFKARGLVVVGWALLLPPWGADGRRAPLTQWHDAGSFRSAAECDGVRAELIDAARRPVGDPWMIPDGVDAATPATQAPAWGDSQCVPLDDSPADPQTGSPRRGSGLRGPAGRVVDRPDRATPVPDR